MGTDLTCEFCLEQPAVIELEEAAYCLDCAEDTLQEAEVDIADKSQWVKKMAALVFNAKV